MPSGGNIEFLTSGYWEQEQRTKTMTASATPSGFFPRLALRRRTADHPMILFALVTGISLGAMAFASVTAPVASGEAVRGLEPKQDRLRMAPKDVACKGQAWGSESDECLTMIALEAGRSADLKVRRLASAEPLGTTPNVF
jgi:hypothetical protein